LQLALPGEAVVKALVSEPGALADWGWGLAL
jgi:hypothetical protein